MTSDNPRISAGHERNTAVSPDTQLLPLQIPPERVEFWRGRKVLVTGAGGFIGSHLCEALAAAGAKVRALVRYNSRGDWGSLELTNAELRSKLEVIAGDITDRSLVSEAVDGIDTVFHLAALIAIPFSFRAPEEFVNVNVGGTLTLLEALRMAPVKHLRRLVHTSTSEVLGTAQTTPMAEDHPLNPQSPYAASKCGADVLASSYFTSFDLPVVTVRPFNCYGPRQSARAVIVATAIQALFRDKVKLGALDPRRDFTFVGDTVNGFLCAAEAPPSVLGQLFHLGSGSARSIGDSAQQVLEAAAKVSGKPAPPLEHDPSRLRPEASEVRVLLADSTRAKQALGWTPQVSFEAGIEELVRWVAANPGLYKPDIYNI